MSIIKFYDDGIKFLQVNLLTFTFDEYTKILFTNFVSFKTL